MQRFGSGTLDDGANLDGYCQCPQIDGRYFYCDCG
jgi:hypothetical protein